jgi:hypothetical protein
MRRFLHLALFVFLLSLTGTLPWHNDVQTSAAPLDLTRGPTVNLLNESSVTLIWDTPTATQTQVRYSTDPGFGSFTQTPLNSTLVTNHRVEISSGLLSNTTYYYRVGDGTDWSDTFEFTTAPAGDEPFTFLVYGDHRPSGGIEVPPSLTQLIDVMIPQHPRFIISNGDHIMGDNSAAWPYYVAETDRLHCNATYWVSMGNHDQPETQNMAYWFEWANEETRAYYSFDYGNSHFIVLDAYDTGANNVLGPVQRAWLENDLASTNAKHRFVICHPPFFPTGGHTGDSMDVNITERDALWQLFEDNYVEAVFVAHEHYYHRLQVGTIPQITSGGGGAPLRDALYFDNFATEVYHKLWHFVRVDVNGDEVTYTAIDINNTIIDTFSTVSVLTQRPTVTDIMHTPSHPQHTDSVVISATATSGSPINSVTCKYKLTTESGYSSAPMTVVSGSQYSTDLGNFADQQQFYYYIEVNDTAGAMYQSRLHSFSVDEIGPTVSFTAPSAGEVLSGTLIVVAHGEDAIGIAYIEVYLDGALKVNVTAVDAPWTWDTTTVPDGTYELKAIAYDLGGNSAETTILVTVANEGSLPPLPIIPLAIGGVTVLVVVVLVVVFVRRRKALKIPQE